MSQVDSAAVNSHREAPRGEMRHKCIALAALCELGEQELEAVRSRRAKDSNKDL